MRITFDQIGVSSDFAGTVLTVDATNYKVADFPVSFLWNLGSSHSFAYQSPLLVTPSSKQYSWTSTSGLSTLQSGSITVSTSGNITGSYKTQYYLVVTSLYDSPNPASGWFDSGTSITASVASPVSGPSGTRYVCTGWTGTGSVSASGTSTTTSFTFTQASSITWNWKTQYQVAFGQTGVDSDFAGAVFAVDSVNYTRNSSPAFWWDSGSSHPFSFFSPLIVDINKQYNWVSTSGLTALQTGTLAATNSGNVIANYATQSDKYQITFDHTGIGSDFNGTVMTVDGTSISAHPASFFWDNGSTHTFSFSSPIAVANGKQHIWVSTTGLSTLQSGSITVSGSGNITGNYKTQFQIAFSQTGVGNDFAGTIVTVDGTAYNSSSLFPSVHYGSFGASGFSNRQATITGQMDGSEYKGSVTGIPDGITATAQSITVALFGLGEIRVRCAIYYSSNRSLVTNGITDEITITAGSVTWYTLSFSDPKPMLYPNTDYVLAVQGTGQSCSVIGKPAEFADQGVYQFASYPYFPNPANWGRESIEWALHCNYTFSSSFWWDEGSVHSFTYQSPLIVTPNEKRYVWINTSGLSDSQSGLIVSSSPGNITGNFKTQFYLSVVSDYATPIPAHSLLPENLSTYSEYDPNNHISTNETSATATNLLCSGEAAYLYKDFGTGYFTDLTHKFSARVDFSNTSSGYDVFFVWQLSNDINDAYHMAYNGQHFLAVEIHKGMTPHKSNLLVEICGSGEWWNSSLNVVSDGSWYYFTVKIRGLWFWCEMYSSPSRTPSNLVANVTGDLSQWFGFTPSFRYLYVLNTYFSSTPGSGIAAFGQVCNLNLNVPGTIGVGQGWYDEGATAYAALESGLVDSGNGTRHQFSNWSGDTTGEDYAQSNAIVMSGPKTAVANWKTQYFLTVSSAYGTIGGQDWYDSASTAYATLTPLTVSGTPGTQYVFTGWDGDATGATSPSNPITMNGPKTATANWKVQYYLTVMTDPLGIATISGEGWYDDMTSVLLSAPTVQDHSFNYWDVDSVSQGNGVNPISVAMEAPRMSTAHYMTFPLSVSITPTSASIDVGQSVTITSTVTGGTSPYIYQWYLCGGDILGNLVANPGFETGSLAGWTQEGPSVPWIRTDEHHTGSYSCASPYVGPPYSDYLPFRITQKLPSVSSNFVTKVGCWYKYGFNSTDWLRVNYTDGSVSSVAFSNVGAWTYVSLNLAPNKIVDSLIIERTASQKAIICIDDVEVRVNGAPVSGANGSNWTFTADSAGIYDFCVIAADNSGLSANSNIATVTVNSPPSVTISPTSVTMNVDQHQLLTSSVTNGTPPYTYQWYLDDTPVSGATSPTWTLTPTTNGTYHVYLRVTDSVSGTAQSNAALVTVVSGSGGVHDIAQTGITNSKSGCLPFPTIGQNETCQINVTVSNLGDYSESFNVTVYGNSIEIQRMAVIDLAPLTVRVLTVNWSTIGFAKGNYTISALAEPVIGETNTTNNNIIGETVAVVVQGDINGDGIVDIFDIVRVALSFGMTYPHPGWDPNADLNNDGIIDIFDIVIVAVHFGETG